MNLLRTSRQALRLAITLVLTLVASAAITMWSGISPASASDWNPPAPTPYDKCGTRWDRYMLTDQSGTVWRVNGESRAAGTWHSTNGAASIAVVAKNYIDPDKTFVVTFDNESSYSCVEAPNQYRVEVGGCLPDGSTKATAYFTNTADTSELPMPFMMVTGNRGDGGVTRNEPVRDIPDGTTVAFVLQQDQYGGVRSYKADGGDHWWFKFWIEDGTNTRVIETVALIIPPCGVGGNPAGPSAYVTKCTAKKCTLQLDNRGVGSSTTFQVVAKPSGKKAVKRSFTVPKDRSMTVKVKAKKVKKVTVKTSGKRVLKQKFPARCQPTPIVPKAYSKACYARIA